MEIILVVVVPQVNHHRPLTRRKIPLKKKTSPPLASLQNSPRAHHSPTVLNARKIRINRQTCKGMLGYSINIGYRKEKSHPSLNEQSGNAEFPACTSISRPFNIFALLPNFLRIPNKYASRWFNGKDLTVNKFLGLVQIIHIPFQYSHTSKLPSVRSNVIGR